ncbi:MAG: AI-2E family transporter [Thermostichales cyanobacterium DRC_bins_46]
MGLVQRLGLLAWVVFFYALWQVRQMLMLLFTAVVLAVAIDTLAAVPQRLGLSRGLSILVTGLVVLLLGFLGGLLIVPPLVEQFAQLLSLLPKGASEAQDLLTQFYARLPVDVQPPSLQEIFTTLAAQLNMVLGRSLAIFSSLLSTVVGVLIVLVLTALLLADPVAYAHVFMLMFPAFYRPRVHEILWRCRTALQRWLIGIMITSSLVMLLSAVGLWLLGVPLVLANAALAGLLNLIPNVGPTLSVVAPMMVALTVSPWKPLAVLILYILIQQAETYILAPFVMSRQVRLLPGIILLSQIFFTTFFGVLGLFLAVPLAAVLQVWIQEVVVRDVLDRWQVGSPVPSLPLLKPFRPDEGLEPAVPTPEGDGHGPD